MGHCVWHYRLRVPKAITCDKRSVVSDVAVRQYKDGVKQNG